MDYRDIYSRLDVDSVLAGPTWAAAQYAELADGAYSRGSDIPAVEEPIVIHGEADGPTVYNLEHDPVRGRSSPMNSFSVRPVMSGTTYVRSTAPSLLIQARSFFAMFCLSVLQQHGLTYGR